MVYGRTVTHYHDAGPEFVPYQGFEFRILSAGGRSERGYVIESSKFIGGQHPTRYRLRLTHVPLDQLAGDAYQARRYGPGYPAP